MTTTSGRTWWRHTGNLLVAAGMLHIVVFVAASLDGATDIVKAGLINTIGTHEDRAVFWYGGIMAGVALVLLGLLAKSWIRVAARPLPRYFGWVLVVLGLCTAVLDPLSGGVLVLAIGILALSGPRT